VHINPCARTHTHTHTHTHIYRLVDACIYTHMRTHASTNTHTLTHKHTHTHTRAYLHAHTHSCAYLRTHAHVHTWAHAHAHLIWKHGHVFTPRFVFMFFRRAPLCRSTPCKRHSPRTNRASAMSASRLPSPAVANTSLGSMSKRGRPFRLVSTSGRLQHGAYHHTTDQQSNKQNETLNDRQP